MGPGFRRDDIGGCRLAQRLDLRGHVGRAADPVNRVRAFQYPDRMVRPGPFLVADRALRLVARKALNPDLCGEPVLRLLRISGDSGGNNGEACEDRSGVWAHDESPSGGITGPSLPHLELAVRFLGADDHMLLAAIAAVRIAARLIF